MKPIRALLALAVMLMAGCANRPPHVSAVTHAPPPKAAPVATAVDSYRSDSKATAVVSTKLESQVAGLRQTTATLKERMMDAVNETAKLKAAKGATEEQINRLCDMLTDANMKVATLEADAAEAQATADEQQRLRFRAEESLSALAQAATAKDIEADVLRIDITNQGKDIEAMAKERADMAKKLTAAEKSAAVGKYLQWWVVAIVAAIVLFLVVRFYLPRMRLT